MNFLNRVFLCFVLFLDSRDVLFDLHYITIE